jgi:hypothetical protein
MGGFGSGRHGGRATVEGCDSLVLDVDRIIRPVRQAMRKLGISEISDDRVIEVPWNAFCWTRNGDPKPWATVEYRLQLRSHGGVVWLRYDVDHFSRRTGPQEHRLTLVTTSCRFGGVRWGWICPATGRRVRKLYLPNGGTQFLSRGQGAYRLDYASQRQDRMDRAHSRSARLYRRLGANYYGAGGSWPPKPKLMRWTTYERLICEIDVTQERLDAAFMVGAVKLLARIEKSERRKRMPP